MNDLLSGPSFISKEDIFAAKDGMYESALDEGRAFDAGVCEVQSLDDVPLKVQLFEIVCLGGCRNRRARPFMVEPSRKWPCGRSSGQRCSP